MDTLHDTAVRGFASDNYSGVHPEVLAALAAANGGHQISYGEDAYTERLQHVVRGHFGADAAAFPVFNGTGANVTGLQSMLPRWGAVIAASTAHINVDEGGAPEKVAGIKILSVPTDDGKLTPELVDREAWGWGDEHRAQPLVVSITQSTELGTLYTPDEIRALADHAHGHGMRLHLDGARISNAAAALDLPLAAFTRDVGVDVLSLGGTKNGALAAEAVVVLDAANAMAERLRAGVEAGLADGSISGVSFTQPTQANGLFAVLPEGVADRLRTSFRFYDWDASRREVRWMCSFDTSEHDIDAFVAAIARETSAA
jgi:threonine aldolase